MSYLVNDHRIDLNHQFIWCPNNLYLSLEWYFESHWCKRNYDIIIKPAKEQRKKRQMTPEEGTASGVDLWPPPFTDVHVYLDMCAHKYTHQSHQKEVGSIFLVPDRVCFPCFIWYIKIYLHGFSQMFSTLPATAQPSAHLELVSRSHDSHFLSFLL